MRDVLETLGELLAIALVYVAVGLTLGVFREGQASVVSLGGLLLINLLVIAAASWYVAHTAGFGWAVGAGVASMLAAMQILLPRLELALEMFSGLRGMALIAVLGGITALVAAVGLVMAFGPEGAGPEAHDPLWLPFSPAGYAWRLLTAVAVYAALQFAAVSLARSFRPPTIGGPDQLDVIVARLVCGAVWVGAFAVASRSLEARTWPIVRAFVGLAVVAGLAGRLVLTLGRPLDLWLPRTLLPGAADLLAALVGAFLLLPSLSPSMQEPDLDDEEGAPRPRR